MRQDFLQIQYYFSFPILIYLKHVVSLYINLNRYNALDFMSRNKLPWNVFLYLGWAEISSLEIFPQLRRRKIRKGKSCLLCYFWILYSLYLNNLVFFALINVNCESFSRHLFWGSLKLIKTLSISLKNWILSGIINFFFAKKSVTRESKEREGWHGFKYCLLYFSLRR